MATRDAARPLFAVSDARFLAELPWLWFVAWFLPENRWDRLCRGLERFKSRLGWFKPDEVAAIMARGLGRDPSPDLAIRWAAGRTECHLEVLRLLRPGFGGSLSFEISGLEHLTEAVAKGRGCLLWVAHFCFNSLAVKAAISGAGYRLWHVSRREHGFSKTRFGMFVLNPMRVAAERRYLAGRILIDRASPGGALVAARRTLEAGDVVSFTAGAWEGVRPIDVDLVGSRLPLSTGAPGLALMTGTPLLPIFATRADRGKVRIEIGSPIAIPSDGARDDKLRSMAQEFADRTEPYIRQCPGEWRGWRNLKGPASGG